jgi:hypothetical protein
MRQVLFVLAVLYTTRAVLGETRTPWGFGINIGAGPTWGRPAQVDKGVFDPTFEGPHLDFNASVRYVYVGAGGGLLGFDDQEPLIQEITDLGGSNRKTAISTAVTGTGFGEIGLNYPLLIRMRKGEGDENQFIEFLPIVTYGFCGVGDLSRDVQNCIDCKSEKLSVDYQGGDYLGLTLGIYWAIGPIAHASFGLTTTYRYFIQPTERSLTKQLFFSLTIRVARD